jgi:hypothetical protein
MWHTSNISNMDVLGLVQACQDQPEGIEDLLEVVYLLEMSTKARQRLDEVARLLFQPILLAEVVELNKIVARIAPSNEKLRDLFYASLSDDWSFPEGDSVAVTRTHVVRFLARIVDSEDGERKLPLLRFVTQLETITENVTIRSNLREWADRVRQRDDPGHLESGRNAPQDSGSLQEVSAPTLPLYLQIELAPKIWTKTKPRSLKETEFRVRAWLWQGQREGRVKYEKAGVLFKNVEAELDFIFEEIREPLKRAANQLVIEFFLPLYLLNYHVDHWRTKDDAPIGVRYPVVVRSWDRATNGTWHPAWRGKWLQFSSLSQTASQNPILRVCKFDQCYPDRLGQKLRLPSIFGLALPFPPTGVPRAKVYKTLLSVGIPIALWPRRIPQSSEEGRRELDHLLSSSKFATLPENLRDRRDEARAQDPPHLGYHMTLLWDDPDRVPQQEEQGTPFTLPDKVDNER